MKCRGPFALPHTIVVQISKIYKRNVITEFAILNKCTFAAINFLFYGPERYHKNAN